MTNMELISFDFFRSCTAAMVYLMLSEGWDAVDVLTEFRKRRDVRPNDHFLAQVQ